MRSAGVLEPYKIGYAVYGGAEAYFSSAAVGAGYHIIHKPFEACTNESFAALAVKTCLFDEKVKTKAGMRQFKTYKSPLIDSDGNIFGTCLRPLRLW